MNIREKLHNNVILSENRFEWFATQMKLSMNQFDSYLNWYDQGALFNEDNCEDVYLHIFKYVFDLHIKNKYDFYNALNTIDAVFYDKNTDEVDIYANLETNLPDDFISNELCSLNSFSAFELRKKRLELNNEKNTRVIKRNIKQELKEIGYKVTLLSEEFNISRPTIDKWISMYEDGIEIHNEIFNKVFTILFYNKVESMSDFAERINRAKSILSVDNSISKSDDTNNELDSKISTYKITSQYIFDEQTDNYLEKLIETVIDKLKKETNDKGLKFSPKDIYSYLINSGSDISMILQLEKYKMEKYLDNKWSLKNSGFKYEAPFLIDPFEQILIRCSPVLNDVKINIPDGIRTILEGAFENNKMIERVVIPGSVSIIQRNAFKNCTNLKEVYIKDSNDNKTRELYFDSCVFENCSSLKSLIVDSLGFLYNSHNKFSLFETKGTIELYINKDNGEKKLVDRLVLPADLEIAKQTLLIFRAFKNIKNISFDYHDETSKDSLGIFELFK